MQETYQNLEGRMDRIIEWVKTCDNKASILFSIDALIITIMLSGDYCMNGLRTIMATVLSDEYEAVSISGVIAIICLIVTVGLLIRSLYFCIKVVGAKTNETQTGKAGVKTNSLIHFHHISQLEDYELFKAELSKETSNDYLEDLKSQIYINAVRCNEKFDDYNNAIKLIKTAIPFAIGYIVFITLFLAKFFPFI